MYMYTLYSILTITIRIIPGIYLYQRLQLAMHLVGLMVFCQSSFQLLEVLLSGIFKVSKHIMRLPVLVKTIFKALFVSF